MMRKEKVMIFCGNKLLTGAIEQHLVPVRFCFPGYPLLMSIKHINKVPSENSIQKNESQKVFVLN